MEAANTTSSADQPLDYSERLLCDVLTERWDGKPRSRTTLRDYFQTLDPQRDYEEIDFLATYYEFPFDTQRALELALVRVFAVPFSSEVLVKSGQFEGFPQKRYDDTVLILAEILESGLESERGRAAVRLMNQIHNRFNISNEEFIYVLTTFVFEPIRWNARFGWRPLTQNEKLATFYYWQRLGQMMGIKNIPATYEALEQYNRDYEAKNFAFADANRRLGQATINLYLSWFPPFLRFLARQILIAIYDDPMLEAFGFARPPKWWRFVIENAMKVRAQVLRRLPARRKAVLFSRSSSRSYPHGYQLSDLGPRQ